jgi:hypothetical protein
MRLGNEPNRDFRRQKEEPEQWELDMTYRAHIAFAALAALSVLVTLPAGANASVRCLEHKTMSGRCIDPTQSVRQDGMVFSQPKISQTAYPVLQSNDSRYRYPNNLLTNR